PARALSVQRTWAAPDYAAARGQRGMAAAGDPDAGPFGMAARLAGAGGTAETLSARQQRCRQLPGVSGDHQRTLWWRAGSPSQAGTLAGDGRLAPARCP